MPDVPSYRLESRTRGVEGPLTAAALVSMARAGLIRRGDRVERSAGRWVPVESARELRAELESIDSAELYLRATSGAAAATSLRFSIKQLVASERGRAHLLALACQHPAVTVARCATDALVAEGAKPYASMAREALQIRGDEDPGSSDSPAGGQRLRDAISAILGDEAWDSFASTASRIDCRGGLTALWPNSVQGEWVSPATCWAGRRTRRAPASTERRTVIDAIAAVRRELKESDGEPIHSVRLSHCDLTSVESLPEDIQQAIRSASWVDLSHTLVRTVPAWVIIGKRSVNLCGSRLAELPELGDPCIDDEDDDSCRYACSIDVSRTAIRAFPASWSARAGFDAIDMTKCALDESSFGNLPACDQLTASGAGLVRVGAMSHVPAMLDLSDNGLSEFPESLRDGIASVASLQLSGNRIGSVPKWLADAGQLEDLDLARNALTRLDMALSAMPSIARVDLSENAIAEIGPGVFSGRRLLSIDLGSNRLRWLPPMVYPADTLRVSNNPLAGLPEPLNDHFAPDRSDVSGDSDEEYEPEDDDDSADDESAPEDQGDSDADGSDDDGLPDYGEFQSDFGDPAHHCVTLYAGSTLVSEFPPELLNIKFSGVYLDDCKKLRELPAALLEMPSLTVLDCSGCSQLAAFAESGPVHFHAWPEERRNAIEEGFADQGIASSHAEAISVNLSGTAFEEIPPQLSAVRRPLDLDMQESMVARWHRDHLPRRVSRLDFHACPLSGPIDIAGIEELSFLSLPRGTGPALPQGLEGCDELETLVLGGIDAARCPPVLSGLGMLESLELVGAELAEIPRFVASLPRLQNLSIRSTSVAAVPGWLRSCPRLESVTVENSPLACIASDFFAAPALESFSVESLSSVLEIEGFPADPKLKSLDIRGPGWLRIPASIARCSCLAELVLDCRIIGDLPAGIGDMQSLREVTLSTSTPSAEVEALRGALVLAEVSVR